MKLAHDTILCCLWRGSYLLFVYSRYWLCVRRKVYNLRGAVVFRPKGNHLAYVAQFQVSAPVNCITFRFYLSPVYINRLRRRDCDFFGLYDILNRVGFG